MGNVVRLRGDMLNRSMERDIKASCPKEYKQYRQIARSVGLKRVLVGLYLNSWGSWSILDVCTRLGADFEGCQYDLLRLAA